MKSSKFNDRLKKDNANAVSILGLFLIIALIVVGGMILDLTKAYQLKASYIDSATKASQIAIRQQTSQGYLKPEALAVAVYEYETRTTTGNFKTANSKNGVIGKCGTGARIMSVYMSREKEKPVFITSVNLNNITATDSIGSVMVKMNLSTNAQKNAVLNGQYDKINIRVLERTTNLILPSATKVGVVNPPLDKCQTIGVNSGAAIFIGSSGQYN